MVKKKTGKSTKGTSFMFPSLHQKIVDVVSNDNISTWFHENDSDEASNNAYSTHVMARFKCNNKACSTDGWSSNAAKDESTSGDHSVRGSAPFEDVNRTDVGIGITDDTTSEKCPDNVDREVHGHLSSAGHTTITHERSGEYDDSNDDSDGGVLLFKGRYDIPSKS